MNSVQKKLGIELEKIAGRGWVITHVHQDHEYGTIEVNIKKPMSLLSDD